MKAVRIHEFGGPDVLRLEDIEVPTLEPDQILVEVRAASVNPVDWKIRNGGYPAVNETDLPMVPGRDLCGCVVEKGADVTSCEVGDKVMAFLANGRGSYEQFAVVAANELAPVPRDATFDEAAAIPLAGTTAWQGLFDHGGLKPGQRVLIHGGTGGVGHFAVQFANAKGAWVATTVSSSDVEFARTLGADQVIDYKNESFEKVLDPVDLVFDLIGGETQERSFAVLKQGGMLVSTLGEPDEELAALNRVRTAGYMAKPDASQLREIGELVSRGEVRVTVNRVYPISQAGEAQRMLEQEHSRGKIVLEVVQ